MGCRGTRAGTEENTFVVECEAKIWTNKLAPALVEAAFYRAMKDGQVSLERLRKLLSTLDFRAPDDLLTSLKTSDDSCDAKKLFSFVLLLSLGSPAEKAASLWDLYDPSAAEIMTKSELEAFFSQLVACSLDFVPMVTNGNTEFSKERLQTWMGNLKPKKGKFAKDMSAVYLGTGDKVTKADFLRIIASNSQADITNVVVIRTRLEEMKMMPTKFANAFAAKSFSTNLSA